MDAKYDDDANNEVDIWPQGITPPHLLQQKLIFNSTSSSNSRSRETTATADGDDDDEDTEPRDMGSTARGVQGKDNREVPDRAEKSSIDDGRDDVKRRDARLNHCIQNPGGDQTLGGTKHGEELGRLAISAEDSWQTDDPRGEHVQYVTAAEEPAAPEVGPHRCNTVFEPGTNERDQIESDDKAELVPTFIGSHRSSDRPPVVGSCKVGNKKRIRRRRYRPHQNHDGKNNLDDGAVRDFVPEDWDCARCMEHHLDAQAPAIGLRHLGLPGLPGGGGIGGGCIGDLGGDTRGHTEGVAGLDGEGTPTGRPLLHGNGWYDERLYSVLFQTCGRERPVTVPSRRSVLDDTKAKPNQCRSSDYVDYWARKIMAKSPCWPQRLPRKQTRRERGLPLHTKHLSKRVEPVLAEALVLPQYIASYQEAKGILFDAESLEPLTFEEPPTEAGLEPGDIEELLGVNYIRKIDFCDARGWLNVFTTDELAKWRRRLITEPRDINAQLTSSCDVRLPNFEEVLRGIDVHAGAETYDFAAFYTAFEIPEEVQPFYCFLYQGQCYALRVLATGQRQCPALAQALSASIAGRVELAMEGACLACAYIDNIRIQGDRESCRIAKQLLFHLCADVGITVNIESPWSESYTFLGITFTHCGDESTVCLSEKTREKLTAWQTELQKSEDWSMRTVTALLGLLQWCASILDMHVHEYYYVYKFLRRRSSHLIDSPAHLWKDAKNGLERFLYNALKADKRRTVPLPGLESNPPIIAYTDACLTGWGVVIFCGAEVSVFAGAFYETEDIQVLEARALYRLLAILPQMDTLTKIVVFCDNTSVVAATTKSRSNNFCVNNILRNCESVLATKNWCAHIRWIPTAENLADEASRLFRDM